MTAGLRVGRTGSVLDVLLDRPERRNALTRDLMAGLRDALVGTYDADVGAIVVHGAGGFLCSGLDLGENGTPDAIERSAQHWFDVHRALAEVDVPVIACLEGGAINAGAALVLGCDLVVAAESGYLQIREAAMGLVPWVNAAWLAVRCSAHVGMQLTLSCRRFYGPELHRLGLALDVVPDNDAPARSAALAAQLAAYPHGGGRRTKEALRAATGGVRAFVAALDAVTARRGPG